MPESIRGATCLHLIVTGCAAALDDCLNQFSAGDVIVFLDGGVMHLTTISGSADLPGNSAVCYSLEDLQARSLLETARVKGVKTTDDRGVARLLREHDHCLTWT